MQTPKPYPTHEEPEYRIPKLEKSLVDLQVKIRDESHLLSFSEIQKITAQVHLIRSQLREFKNQGYKVNI